MTRAEGHGGEPRTVINLANALVERYDVEIISLLRWRTKPVFPIDPRIGITYITDLRPFGPDGKRRDISAGGVDEEGRPVTREAVFDRQRPSKVAPYDPVHWESTDAPLAEAIAATSADLLIGVTPPLNRFISEYAPSGAVKVGQDHMNFTRRTRTPERRAFMISAIERLDAYVPVTEADARDYRALVPNRDVYVTSIPNALPWLVGEPAELTSKVVVAAGRLEPQKGFDRLISAYAPVGRSRPDWRLDIYGVGRLKAKLQAKIDDLKAGDHITLRGYTNDMPGVLSQSSIYAMTSVYEGFGMVLTEAASRGVPQIAYDCPRGPSEIIRDGETGRLIPDGDTQAFTAALLELIDDSELRKQMGEAALKHARQYEMPSIVERWSSLFKQLGVG